MPDQIMLVDDDAPWRTVLGDRLRREGFAVVEAVNGTEALSIIQDTQISLIILDVDLGAGVDDGYDVCLKIRQRFEYIPIIMISGVKKEVIDKVVGLRVGADHYFEKPAEPHEIIAQIRALLRMTKALRAKSSSTGLQHIDARLSWNPDQRSVFVQGENIGLTPKEFGVFRYLLENVGKSCSRADIIDTVWLEDNPDGVTNAAVDIQVSRLRSKIETDEIKYILTVHKWGYKFREF